MAKERDELLDHDYDGIREYDNPLPRWWLGLFYATIAFSIFYIAWHLLGYGLSGPQEYRQEVGAAARPAAAPPPAPGAGPAAQAPKDAATLALGREIFAANCVPCHGPQGQGVIGPNLTDNYWLHGNTYSDIQHTISEGVPDKGMISWRAVLGPQKIAQVAAYVMSLKGSHPPNPKPPQGQLYKD